MQPDLPVPATQAALLEGMHRVTAVINQSTLERDRKNSATIPWQDYIELTSSDSGRIDAAAARSYFKKHLKELTYRQYRYTNKPNRNHILAYGYTKNNQREFDFLNSEIQKVGFDADVVNLCGEKYKKLTGSDGLLSSYLHAALEQFFCGADSIRAGVFHGLCKFAASIQSAYSTLRELDGDLFAVANDHAPAPVAYAVMARVMGMRIIYLQHAEVTRIFPPLDYDLSLLRNQHSLAVYSAIGPIRGETAIADRSRRESISLARIRSIRYELTARTKVDVVIYPSSVLDIEYLTTLLRGVSENPAVASVAVKLHPNARQGEAIREQMSVPVLADIPEVPHVAVCGNSSVVVELLAAGCAVYQDFSLDAVQRDYYGFVAAGITKEVCMAATRLPFWKGAETISESEFYLLADYVPNLRSPRNLQAVPEFRAALHSILTPS